jgi:hypothetical protein
MLHEVIPIGIAKSEASRTSMGSITRIDIPLPKAATDKATIERLIKRDEEASLKELLMDIKVLVRSNH